MSRAIFVTSPIMIFPNADIIIVDVISGMC